MFVFSPATPELQSEIVHLLKKQKTNTLALLGTWDMEKNSFNKNQPSNEKSNVWRNLWVIKSETQILGCKDYINMKMVFMSFKKYLEIPHKDT